MSGKECGERGSGAYVCGACVRGWMCVFVYGRCYTHAHANSSVMVCEGKRVDQGDSERNKRICHNEGVFVCANLNGTRNVRVVSAHTQDTVTSRACVCVCVCNSAVHNESGIAGIPGLGMPSQERERKRKCVLPSVFRSAKVLVVSAVTESFQKTAPVIKIIN